MGRKQPGYEQTVMQIPPSEIDAPAEMAAEVGVSEPVADHVEIGEAVVEGSADGAEDSRSLRELFWGED